MRPQNENENSSAIDVFDVKKRVVQIRKDQYEKKIFSFDSLLEPEITQTEVFETIATPVLDVKLKK